MLRFARWHIWLGWVVAVPMLLWLASGLFMAARPIDEVRGEALKRAPVAVAADELTFPQLSGAVTKVALVDQAGRATWIVTGADAAPRRYDARNGSAIGPVREAEARRLIAAAWRGQAALTALTPFPADAAPLDLRRPRPSWQAGFADGAHLYLDAETGEVLAVRTRWWRLYDFMWGLHIMDLQTREDTSNPFLWVFGGLALVGSVIGTTLLFRRRRARR